MARGPQPVLIDLSDDERAQFESWSRRRTSAAGLAMRSRIVLAAADGGSNVETAARLELDRNTVSRWRRRFAEARLDGLVDEPRPGRPRSVSDAEIEALITETLEKAPKNATHWSTRSMATHLGMSQSTVSRVWRAFGLAPHKTETWKLSKDPQFTDKVRDVVGLYLDPPERALVLCVDEKTQIQALNRTAPTFPKLPGTPERASHDYVRHGTSSLYAALDLATGKVIGSLHSRHRAIELGSSCARSTPRFPPTSKSTSYWTTPRPTRPRRSNAGWPRILASSCTSPRPAARGSTSSSAGSPS